MTRRETRLFAMRRIALRSIAPLVACLAFVTVAASAGAVTIETVPVGNPRADGPTFAGDPRPPVVDYTFRIAKFEVTNRQYTEFLNAVGQTRVGELGLYNNQMATHPGSLIRGRGLFGPDYRVDEQTADLPVSLVSWYDAARFANWMHNGQGDGDTETGAYDLTDLSDDLSRDSVSRSPGARWFLPSEAEWAKAAYHSNDPDDSRYFSYPNGANSIPTASAPTDAPGHANYDGVVGGTTPVGSYPNTPSPYGAFDMAGNATEWAEPLSEGSGALRGGNWADEAQVFSLSRGQSTRATVERPAYGFRLATIVPEPTSPVALSLTLWPLASRRRNTRDA